MFGRLSFDALKCVNVPMDVLVGCPSISLYIGRILVHSCASWHIDKPIGRLVYEHCTKNWKETIKIHCWKSILVQIIMVNCAVIFSFTAWLMGGVWQLYRKQSTIWNNKQINDCLLSKLSICLAYLLEAQSENMAKFKTGPTIFVCQKQNKIKQK